MGKSVNVYVSPECKLQTTKLHQDGRFRTWDWEQIDLFGTTYKQFMAKLRLKAKLYEPIWLVCSLFASCNTIRYNFSLLYCVVLATKMFQRMCPMLFFTSFSSHTSLHNTQPPINIFQRMYPMLFYFIFLAILLFTSPILSIYITI